MEKRANDGWFCMTNSSGGIWWFNFKIVKTLSHNPVHTACVGMPIFTVCLKSACVCVCMKSVDLSWHYCEECMQHYMIAKKLVPVTPEEVE